MNNFKMRLGAFLVASCMFTTSVPVYAASTNSNNTNSSVSNSVEKTESKTSKVDDDVGIFKKIGRSIAPKLFASRSSTDALDRFLDYGELDNAPIRNIYDYGRSSILILKSDGTLYKRQAIGNRDTLEVEMSRLKTNVKAMVGEYIFIGDKIYSIRNDSAGSSREDHYSFTEIATNSFNYLLPGSGIGDDDYLYKLGNNNASLQDKDISYLKDFKNRDFKDTSFIYDGDLYVYNERYMIKKIKAEVKFKKIFSNYGNRGTYMATRYAIGVDNKLYSTSFSGVTEEMTPVGVSVDDIRYIYSVDAKEAILLTKSGDIYVKGSADFCQRAGYNKVKYEDWKKTNISNIKQVYHVSGCGTFYVTTDNKVIHSGDVTTYKYISGNKDWVCEITGYKNNYMEKQVDTDVILDSDEFIIKVSDMTSRVEILTNKRCFSKGLVWDSADPYHSDGLYGTVKFVDLEEDPVDPNLEPAKEAVEQAEKTYKRGDYDRAKDLVDKLKPSDTKEDLTKRLDEVLKKIVENDKNKLDLESATKAVEKSESTLSRDDYNKAKDLTDKLNSSSDKDSLVKRLDEVLDKIKEKEENGKKISDATKAVEKSESTLSKDDYDKAKDLVDKLSSSNDKDNLNKRLDEVLKKINKKEEDAKKLSEATKAVEKAESTLDKSDYNRAKELVDRLPTSSDKDDLNKRLEEVSKKINRKEEQNRLISEADILVKKAEQSCKDDDKRKAQDAVNKIDNCREKDELQNRLDNIKIISKSDLEQLIMDYDKKVTINQSSNLHTLQDLQSLENEGNNLRDKIDDSLSSNEASELISKLNIPLNKVRTEIGAINKAEGLVKKVKLDKTVDNFIDAFVDVSALINSAEKTRLKNELFAIFDDIIKSMSDKEIKDLFDKLKDLVDKGTLEKEDVLILADRIPNKELGKIIKDKLNGIDNSKDEEYKKLLEQLINLATVAVEKAESTGNRGDIDLARVQVNKLPDCSEKDLLNSRLDAIKEVADKGPNSDSGNMDIIAGVKSMISLDLSNVGLDFDDYTGVNNVERKNAVVASITSNMPYSFSVTMLNAITGTDSKNVLKDKSLGIKLSSVGNSYIPLIPDSPLVLVKHHESGEDMKFNLDFKLNASPGSPVDKYKTNLKFEAIQD